MAEPYRCPQCGVAVPRDAPHGLCPACVMKAGFGTGQSDSGLGSESGSAGASGGQFVPPTPAELAPFFPDLEILELVGQGGMGVVYKARQKRLDRLVALKILSPKIGHDPAFAERFQREAKAMAMLSHPHVVGVYDFGQTGEGRYYFLMEFIDGLSLRRLLEAGKLAPEEALAIVPQICDALQYAHDQGVVHRDIKPENILMDKAGHVKIADFGLAKLIGRDPKDFSLTGAGQVMGTPQYMAPEQIEHPLQVDHRADIYSLGVVFYQMLTGELPIGRFALPSKKVQIDVRLDEVVLRALEKEPERRYQQVSEIRTHIETIASTLPSPLGPPESYAQDQGIPPEKKTTVEPVARDAGPRLSKLAIASALSLPVAVLVAVLTEAVVPRVEGGPFFAVLLAGLILGIASLIAIRNSPKTLRGRSLAWIGVLTLPLLILIIVPLRMISIQRAREEFQKDEQQLREERERHRDENRKRQDEIRKANTEKTDLSTHEPAMAAWWRSNVAMLNRRCSQGVTPENNSTVLFVNAIGPGALVPEYREQYFQMLGMAPLPEKGDYFVDLDKFIEASRLWNAGGDREALEKRKEDAWKQHATAMTRPWSKTEFPVLAEWLAANAKPLELAVQASRRPRRYDPLIPSRGGAAISILLPAVDKSRAVVRALVARAMLRVDEGNVDAAWQDLLACHRLARLVGEGHCLVEGIFAAKLNGIARNGDQALLRHGKLTATQIEKMRDDLANLPKMPRVAEKIDFGERLAYLDAVVSAARGETQALSEIRCLGADGKSTGSEPGLESLIKSVGATTIDWGAVVRIGNAWCDRLAAACRKPTRNERKKALERFEANIKALADSFKDPAAASRAILSGPPEVATKRCGQWFVTLLLPSPSGAVDAQDRDTMESELNALAFALAAYRADSGSYPKRLADLVPKYVSAVPKDLFDNDANLRYKPTAHGYLLYSVGVNGKDDGGKTIDDRDKRGAPAGVQWDDLVVETDKPTAVEGVRKSKEDSGKKQISNSIGMKLVLIPAGEFMMGSRESAEHTAAFFSKTYGEDFLKPDDFKDEHPRHRVRITKPFYLGTYHVTRGQFRQFVADSGYKTDAEKLALGGVGDSWRNAGFEQTDEHPVVNVSWNDAVAFCKWLSKKEGKTYRLPTEAEWEYACRAGTTTRYYSGDDPETLAKVGNVADAAAKAKFPDWTWTIKANDGYAFMAPVAKFKPNAFGLYDMHGNAWQWCADWYGAEYYAKSPADDPTGPDSGNVRVLRGGSWYHRLGLIRAAARGRCSPADQDNCVGFRVARTQ